MTAPTHLAGPPSRAVNVLAIGPGTPRPDEPTSDLLIRKALVAAAGGPPPSQQKALILGEQRGRAKNPTRSAADREWTSPEGSHRYSAA